MGIREYLDKNGVYYTLSAHEPSFTAQQVAASEHEPGRFVAKPVIVKADGKYVMCVLPACSKIDMDALKHQLNCKKAAIADEWEIAGLFEDCELGAEPPFGNLYNMETVMDKSLQKDDHIVFQGGTHQDAIHMGMKDYLKLAQPKVLEFSYRMS